MPYDEVDPDDPNLLVGVEAPGDPDSQRDMAYTFGDEYAALGYSEDSILRLFASPRYPALLELAKSLGDEEIRRIVHECCDTWGHVRVLVTDAPVWTTSHKEER